MTLEKLNDAKQRFLRHYEAIKNDADLNDGAKSCRIGPI
jgi:hypothetical protein